MKITKLTLQGIKTVTSEIIEHKGNKYHNLKHGTNGKRLWSWSASMDAKKFSDTDNGPITMDGSDYVLIPITRDGKIVKDGIGNCTYVISKDNVDSHTNDILVLWEIPIKNFNTVSIELSGDVIEVGRGYIGKYRIERRQRIPAPILEITGNCSITWEGVTFKGEKYKQVINYKESNWDINPPMLVSE